MSETETTTKPCVYADECHCEGTHQCAVCKQWYCDECHEMFLPIDPRFWSPTALICPSCHYHRHMPRS